MSKKNKTSSKLSIRRVVALLFTLAITATALISATVIYSLTKEREVNHGLSELSVDFVIGLTAIGTDRSSRRAVCGSTGIPIEYPVKRKESFGTN